MFIFTSDLHVDKGIRIEIARNYLAFLSNKAKEIGTNIIFFGGDMFEKSTKIKNEAFIPLFLDLMQMKNDGFEMYFLLGNHDIYNDYNDSIVECFSPFGRVIKEGETIEIDGYQYDCLSYTKDQTKIPNASNVLLTHLSIADFQFDNGYEVDQKAGFPIDTFEHYDLVVSGHFHRTQNVKNIIFGGSPYQLDFGEEGQTKGFIVIDKNKFTFEKYEEAPTYLTIDVNNFKDYDYSNKFIQVEIDKKIENFVKLKHLLYSKGAIDVKPKFKKQETAEAVMEGSLEITNGNIVAVVKEYLSGLKIENIDNAMLLQIFDTVLEEVK